MWGRGLALIYCCNDRECGIYLIMNGSDFRLFYEDYARHKLAEHWNVPVDKIIHLSKENATSDYDLLFGKLKIDVKFSNPVVVIKNHTAVWDFSLRKVHNNKRSGQNKECDCFILVGMKNGIPKSIYLISSHESPSCHIRIPLTCNSKYEKYKLF